MDRRGAIQNTHHLAALLLSQCRKICVIPVVVIDGAIRNGGRVLIEGFSFLLHTSPGRDRLGEDGDAEKKKKDQQRRGAGGEEGRRTKVVTMVRRRGHCRRACGVRGERDCWEEVGGLRWPPSPCIYI